MTLIADHPARTTQAGDPCPPWCITDHDKYQNFHGGERIRAEAPQYYTWYIRAIKSALTHALTLQVAGRGVVEITPHETEGLAAIIEGLADATPDQHRELAAAIRQAAAQITVASDGVRENGT